MPERNVAAKLGLAAVILLAPGGFILGATLAIRHLRRARAAAGAAVDRDVAGRAEDIGAAGQNQG